MGWVTHRTKTNRILWTHPNPELLQFLSNEMSEDASDEGGLRDGPDHDHDDSDDEGDESEKGPVDS